MKPPQSNGQDSQQARLQKGYMHCDLLLLHRSSGRRRRLQQGHPARLLQEADGVRWVSRAVLISLPLPPWATVAVLLVQ